MNFVRRGVDTGVVIDDLLQSRGFPADPVEILPVRVDEIAVDMNGALAGVGEYDEFVAEIAADGSGFRSHRDRLQSHAGEGAQVGYEHLVVGMPRSGDVEVEAVGVLH